MKHNNHDSEFHNEIYVRDVIHNNEEFISSFVTLHNFNCRMETEVGDEEDCYNDIPGLELVQKVISVLISFFSSLSSDVMHT